MFSPSCYPLTLPPRLWAERPQGPNFTNHASHTMPHNKMVTNLNTIQQQKHEPIATFIRCFFRFRWDIFKLRTIPSLPNSTTQQDQQVTTLPKYLIHVCAKRWVFSSEAVGWKAWNCNVVKKLQQLREVAPTRDDSKKGKLRSERKAESPNKR